MSKKTEVHTGSKLPKDKISIYKKNSQTAHIGALLTQNKSYSTLRLLKDFNEINSQENPLLTVSAVPIDDSLFMWHVNLISNTDNVYKGTILHLDMRFSDFYPKVPPKIKVLNNKFTHPNILSDGSICMDILTNNSCDKVLEGWTPAYSVYSILLQLQAFFFLVTPPSYVISALPTETEKVQKEELLENLRKANEFTCKQCGHKGSSNPKPGFPEVGEKQKNFIMSEKAYKESIRNEFSCILKKTSFIEYPLGYGVSIQRIARTGDIKGVNIINKYLSIKSFQKQRIRNFGTKSTNFTHWFPLYFGKTDIPERFEKLTQHALSMISNGNTKNFSPDSILKVFPKVIIYMVSQIVGDNTDLNSKSIKTLLHFYRSFRFMLDKNPNVQHSLEEYLNKFITNPVNRLKENTPSLGDLLAMALMTKNDSYKDLVVPYIEESLDRSVFWMIKSLPELEELIESSSIDDVRSKVCFNAGIVGHQILLFFNYINSKILMKGEMTNEKIVEKLDEEFGVLGEDCLYNHTKKIKEILKVDSYTKYYEFLNLPVPSEKEFNIKIKQAFQNSLAKKYHGDIDEVRYVPPQEEQFKTLLNKFTPVNDLVDKEGKLLPEINPIWEKLILELDLTKKIKFGEPNVKITPLKYAVEYEKSLLDSVKVSDPATFNKENLISKDFEKQCVEDLSVNFENEALAKLSFRDLYVKTFLEFYVMNFRYIVDFPELYNLLKLFKPHVTHFNLVIGSVENLKSDWNYIRAVVSSLVNVKFFKIYYNTHMDVKIIKNLIKGYNLFLKEGGETLYLTVFSDDYYNKNLSLEHNILTILDKMPNLKCLNTSETRLHNNTMLKIRNHLYYYKTIQSLNLKKCSINDTMAKELVDGIMKAKCLEHLDFSYNDVKSGISSILYNLAFQPMLKYLNIKGNNGSDVRELDTALYKLIKMSMSLEYLDFSEITNLVLSKEFYASLGDNSYIKSVNMSKTKNNEGLSKLGTAVAFNALKKGALTEIFIDGVVKDFSGFKSFVEGMNISEKTHNDWYSSSFNPDISKDSKEYYIDHFRCNLKYLDMSGSLVSGCNIYINHPKNVSPNPLNTLLENSKISSLILNNCTFNRSFVELITDALLKKNYVKTLSLRICNIDGDYAKILSKAFGITKDTVNPNNNIEKIDLSMNKVFGYSGIFEFSKVLTFNKTIKVLNLFHNMFDVNGARRLAEALEVNTTLESLNIGYNRIRDLGLKTILNSLKANKNTNLKHLATRYNFIRTNTFLKLLDSIANKENKINSVEIQNNNIEEKQLLSLYKKYYSEAKEPLDLYIDIFNILYHIDPEKIERTVWISPLSYNITKNTLLQTISDYEKQLLKKDKSYLGIVKNISIKRGRKTGEKKNCNNSIAFIEFVSPNSCNLLLKLAASTEGFSVSGKRMRIYKAGTKTDFIFVKSAKFGNNPKDGFKSRKGKALVRGRGVSSRGRGFKSRGTRGNARRGK